MVKGVPEGITSPPFGAFNVISPSARVVFDAKHMKIAKDVTIKTGVKNIRLFIFPSSFLAREKPDHPFASAPQILQGRQPGYL